MKNKKIVYKNFIQKKYLNTILNKKLKKNYSSILKNILTNLDFPNDIFYSLSNKFKYDFNTKDLNKFKKFKTVAIIGMGGSILGSEAMHSFCIEKIRKLFLFLDDIDERRIKKIKREESLNNVLFIVISKSGKTIETLSNLLALQIIKKKSKNIIIVSEKSKNPLYLLSQKFGIYHIPHKKSISGRYSVLSEVGAVPAYFMGLNIYRLRKNLLSHFSTSNKKFLKDSSIKMANLFTNKKFKNLVFFNYVPQLDKFLYWNQQLIAESLGKKGKGFLPLISNAPKDHHSLLQLYLDGPRDKLFYIFSAKEDNSKRIRAGVLERELQFLNDKSLDQIKMAQKNSFISVLKKNNIPFREFKIKDFSEQTLGELFAYFMLETAIVGKLSKINPFDQPAVEQVKISTKKKLD